MKPYHKIDTIYKRDMDNGARLVEGDWSSPYFELLKDIKWIATEKIDGTNIRIIWDGITLDFKGRTDKAVIPSHLLSSLSEMFTHDKLASEFGTEIDRYVCLYGEGYGKKIQKGGNYIPDSTSFILFDVRVGEWWLTRDSVVEIAESLGINVVPKIGEFTLQEAVEYVRCGFKSTIAYNKNYEAEGLVLKPKEELFMRNGQRIVTKIKHRDFANSIS